MERSGAKWSIVEKNEALFFRLITSERNLGTLVKVNRLSFLSGSCSEGPNLPGYNFSEG